MASKDDPPDKPSRISWTNEMLNDLQTFRDQAIIEQRNIRKTGRKASYLNILLDLWNRKYDRYQLTAGKLQSRLYAHEKKTKGGSTRRQRSPSRNGEDTTSSIVCEEQNEEQNEFQNLPTNLAQIMRYRGISERHAAKPLVTEICYNCGSFVFGRISEGHKFSVVSQVFPVETLYRDPPSVPCKSKHGIVVSCRRCKDGPVNHFPCGDDNGKMFVPNELKQLKNTYEHGQVSLCGIFSHTYAKINPLKRKWEHRRGETNLLSKQDSHYRGMYGYVVGENNTDAPSVSDRIRQALLWLKTNNPLFNNFFARVETLFRFSDNQSCLQTGTHLHDAKGRSVADTMQKETTGLMVPLHAGTETVPKLSAHEDVVGIQHGKLKDDGKSLFPENFTYGDPNLEAKAWPALFPFGRGSWFIGGGLDMSEYCKMRLLNFDARWRKNPDWIFFWVDRMMKRRLFYYNRAKRLKRSGLTKEDVTKNPENPYARYGTDIPTTIPGSKAFWSSKCLDILAMSKELGQPDFFVTLTQNDNWPELQTFTKHGPAVASPLRNVDDSPLKNNGEPCVTTSVETCIAFHERFKLFKEEVLEKEGPLGKVLHYWWRYEYQHRGAIHVHMVVWVDKETIPEDAVVAELPRGAPGDPFVEASIQMVKQFQSHRQCVPNRCFKGPAGKVLTSCKYGFPFSTNQQEKLDSHRMRVLYRRRLAEDALVVPYNLKILWLMTSHVNIQRITQSGWELYLGKYVTKSEPSFDMLLPEDTSAPERFLRTRIIGLLEATNMLLGYNVCRGSIDVKFLPTDIDPTHGVLKRNEHMPDDPNSDEIFYDTLFEKYLDRPVQLHDILYPDYIRQYDIGNKKGSLTDMKGRKVAKRNKFIIPRWKFQLPWGTDQDKYFEQKLVLNIPFTRATLQEFLSSGKTSFEECARRGLLQQETEAREILNSANIKGFSMERIREIAQYVKETKWLSSQECDSLVNEIEQSRPEELSLTVTDEGNSRPESAMGDLLTEDSTMKPLSVMRETFSTSQQKTFEFIERKLQTGAQLLTAIVGQAGTGKSYLISALESLAREQNIATQKLATTGVAAYLIRGQTVHSFFKMDVNCKSYLEPGTFEYQRVLQSQLIIIDEFSMLEEKVFFAVDKAFRTASFGANHQKPFGGRHVILVGDPCQLPAIDKDIFDSYLWQQFFVLTITDVQRQKDEQLMGILNEARLGYLSDTSQELLQSRLFGEEDLSSLDPADPDNVIIVSLRQDRDRLNAVFLDKLPGVIHTFDAIDKDSCGQPISEVDRTRLQKYHRERLPDKISLKIGAKVQLVKNLDIASGWTNGALCVVVAIAGDCVVLEHLMTKKRTVVSRMLQTLAIKGANYSLVRSQLPLILGWAITTHKCQGMTLSTAYILLNDSFFASGQAYTALSRVKSLAALHLLAFDTRAIILSDRVKWVMQYILQNDALADNKIPTPPEKHENEVLEEETLKSTHVTTKNQERKMKQDEGNKTSEQRENDNEGAQQVQNILVAQPHLSMTSYLRSNVTVDSLDYFRFRVTGSGDCFYKCLSSALYGHENNHFSVRRKICELMSQHLHAFAKFYDNANEEELANHVIQQGFQGAWATQVEIFAAATWLQVPIYVYMRNNTQKTWLYFEPVFSLEPLLHDCNYFVSVVNDYDMHYDLLIPKGFKCTCMMASPIQDAPVFFVDMTED